MISPDLRLTSVVPGPVRELPGGFVESRCVPHRELLELSGSHTTDCVPILEPHGSTNMFFVIGFLDVVSDVPDRDFSPRVRRDHAFGVLNCGGHASKRGERIRVKDLGRISIFTTLRAESIGISLDPRPRQKSVDSKAFAYELVSVNMENR